MMTKDNMYDIIVKTKEGNIMFCSKCGSNVPDGAPFCRTCGKQMRPGPVPANRNAAVNNPVPRVPVPQAAPVQQKKNNNIPVIIGCAVGGFVLIILIMVLIIILAGGTSDLDDVNWDSDNQVVDTDESAEEDEPQFEWVEEPYLEADDMGNVYDYTGHYPYDGFSIYYVDGKCGIIDSMGNKICEPEYTDPGYCEPMEGIVLNDHRLLYDIESGRLIEHGGHGGGFSKLVYDLNSEKYMYICGGDGPSMEIDFDATGCYIVYECHKEYSDTQSGQVYYSYLETGRIGLYNNGELVVPFEYELTTGLSDGIAAMYDGSEWTYFDTDGNVVYEDVPVNDDVLDWNKLVSVTDYTYEETSTDLVYKYNCKCVPVKKGDKWGYMDTDGEMIIDAQFEKALPAFNYRAWVCVDGKWGIISIE